MTPPLLSPSELTALTRLRYALHAAPEISGAEVATATHLRDFLAPTGPDRVVEGLGGAGLALVFDSGKAGPRVMFRAELDGLPITEQTGLPYASRRAGVAHLCGHDGHMAILAGLGLWLSRNRPARGQVILLFQPAEETGEGARAVLADPRFAQLRPDWAFALHNMPGLALGEVAVAAGGASCASCGLRLRVTGRESHAAHPEAGQSPAPVLEAVLAGLSVYTLPPPMGRDFRLVTLCHLSMGQPAFGIAPGQAEIWLTLRAYDDQRLAAFEAEIMALITRAAQGLTLQVSRHDAFHATINAAAAADQVVAACAALGVARGAFELPMRASEDFGAFSAQTRTALFFLGAGERQPALHRPDYDFPDALIAPAVALYAQIATQILGGVAGPGGVA
ncbi:MAG: amidohydrolase [Rhodobacteraceae bacterium]|nr:MAG: amidohydrolase [Paracoccaceae bacterium]